MILLRNPYITISLLEAEGYIHQKWTGFCPSRNFRRAIDITMDALHEYDMNKILSDVTEQKVVSPDDQEYTKQNIIDFLQEHDRVKLAFVTDKNSII